MAKAVGLLAVLMLLVGCAVDEFGGKVPTTLTMLGGDRMRCEGGVILESSWLGTRWYGCRGKTGYVWAKVVIDFVQKVERHPE